MPELIAAPPWYLPSAVAVIALILLFQGNRLQSKPMRNIGLACAMLATVVMALGHFLESDREIVERRTRELASAVDRRDWQAFGDLLDPKVSFEKYYVDKASLLSGAQATAERVGVKNITVTGLDTKYEANAYQVDFTASADIDIFNGGRAPTNWRFFWAKSPQTGEFLLFDIRAMPNRQFGTEAVTSRLVGTR